jgi:hypothetical protein
MADKNVVININTAIDQGGLDRGIKDVEKKVDDLNKGDETSIRIKLAMEKLSESKSLKDYKTSLRELKGLALEVGDTNKQQFNQITTAIGETNDKISDMNSVIKSTSGEPIENLGRSFRGVGDNLKALDFKTAKSQFDVMTDSAKKLTGQLFGGFNVMKNYKTAMMEGKTSTESLSIATKGLGKAVAATGIGLLVIAVAALIANFDKLKTSGGIIGSMFSAIGDVIEFVTQKLKDLSDMLGLTDFEGQKKAENTVKNSEKEQEAITERYDAEIKLAKAAGKDTTELEKDKLKAVMASIQAQIGALETLSKSGTQLTDEQKTSLEDYKKKIREFNTDLAVIDAEAQKKNDDDKEKAKEKQKIADDKEKERIKRHKDEIRKIEEKYLLSNRDKLAAGYDDDLKKFNLKNSKEKKMYDDLLFAKTMALDKYDKDRQAERDKAGEENAKDLEDKFNKEQEIREKAALNAKQIQLEALQFQETVIGSNKLDLIKKETDLELSILQSQMDAELSNVDLTGQERQNIQDKYRGLKEQKEKESKDRLKAQEEEYTKRSFDMAVNLTQGLGNLSDILFSITSGNRSKGSEEEKKAAEKQFKIAKGISLAIATITGIQSVMEAYKNGMKNPVPLLGPATATIYAVTAGLASAANLAKISSTKFDSSSYTTPSVPSVPSVPNNLPSNTIPAGSTIGLGETRTATLAQNTLQYQQVFVTETDITKVQNKVNVIENRSRIR